MVRHLPLYNHRARESNVCEPSGIPRSKTRGLMAPRAKTAKIWPGHILKLQSVPNPKSPKI